MAFRAAGAAPGPRTPRAKSAWTSRNVRAVMRLRPIQPMLRRFALVEQDREGRDRVVPLEQGGAWPVASQGGIEQAPDGGIHPARMIIDEDRGALDLAGRVPAEMELADRVAGDSLEVVRDLEAVVVRAHVNVVDVEQ